MTHEASDFGWKAGFWPKWFMFDGVMWYRGERLGDYEDFVGYEYRTTDSGECMTVFND